MWATHPTLSGDTLVFGSEGQLWSVHREGGRARRLTDGRGPIGQPRLSPDGRRLAMVGHEEGSADLYIMPAEGGPLVRRTWIGSDLILHGFDSSGEHLLFSSAHASPFAKFFQLYRVHADSGIHELVGDGPHGIGPVSGWSVEQDVRALVRHQTDLAHWRRYRGGRVGRLWVDSGAGFRELPSLGGNLACPIVRNGRIAFVSDHEDQANLYDCALDGSDVQRLTQHARFPVRFPTSADTGIHYVHGGAIHRVGGDGPLPIDTRSPRSRRGRRALSALRTTGSLAVCPLGERIVVTARGKPFEGGAFEGPLQQVGVRHGVRHRLVCFLDDQHLAWVSDASGEDAIEVHSLVDRQTTVLHTLPSGRITTLCPGPEGQLAFTTHDGRVGTMARDTTVKWLMEAPGDYPTGGLTWSPDGAWLAWHRYEGRWLSRIQLAEVSTGAVTDVTDGRHADRNPDFDPLGRFLFFVGARRLRPVRDGRMNEYGFPRPTRPYLVLLQRHTPSPFEARPRPLGKLRPPKRAGKTLEVDLDGLMDRLVAFPVADGNYVGVHGLPSGRVLICRKGIEAAKQTWRPGSPPRSTHDLALFDFSDGKLHPVHDKINRYALDARRTSLILRSTWRVRVIPADPDKGRRAELKRREPYRTGRATGWVDLERARLFIEPAAEWRQMLDEAWRLMRDGFWDEQLAGVDWDEVLDRYRVSLEQIDTRAELTDLLMCMGGELGTSHAYVMGGDHPSVTRRAVGRLAARFDWRDGSWTLAHAIRGEPGDPTRRSPLLAPGLELAPGTRILEVDRRSPIPDRPLAAHLVGHAGQKVSLRFQRPGGEPEDGWVTPLRSDTAVRYRDWVRANRERIHAASDGRCGYLHIPDMGPTGFGAFHEDWLAESRLGGLLVDVRWNRGGHVSQLLLGRLMRKRMGWVQTRSFGRSPHPSHAIEGPMVALINEYCGSDGDIFAHNWRALELGPLVGTRTWGGVVGISPRFPLVDGTVVTQPEFANAFDDVGYGLEGRGVEPDVEVRISPAQWANFEDPQLDAALEAWRQL